MNKFIYTTALTLILYTIFGGRICFGNTDDIIGFFNERQAIIYGIWWVRPNQKLASIKGNIDDLDLLILDLKPETIGKSGFNPNSPSYPFAFNENKLIEVKDELLKNNQVVIDSIQRKDDNWGVSLSFKLKKYPDYEIRRYPAYIIILSDKVSIPLKNKDDYQAVLHDIRKIIADHLAKKTELSEIMESYDEKNSLIIQPMYLVTHLYVDHISFIYFAFKDGDTDTKRSIEEFIMMGILPNKDFYFDIFDSIFFATDDLSTRIIVTCNKPVFFDESYYWFGESKPTDYFIERVLRWSLFNDLLINHALDSSNKISEGLEEALKKITTSKSISNFDKNTETFSQKKTDYQKYNIDFRKQIVDKIVDTMEKLDGLLYLSDEQFAQKFYMPKITTWMPEEFIKFVLKYEPGSYKVGESSNKLKKNKDKLEIEISEADKHLNNINSQYATISSSVFNRISYLRDLNKTFYFVLFTVIVGGIAVTMWSSSLKDLSKIWKIVITIVSFIILIILILILL